MGWPWQWSLSAYAMVACVLMALKVIDSLWWRPRRLERQFAKQGIRGPPYRFFFGCVKEMVGLMLEASSKPMAPHNSHDILPRVLPFYHHWNKIYGSPFLLWFGPTPRIAIAEPDLIREILVSRPDVFERYEAHPMVRQLEGEGLVSLRDDKWDFHRKVLSPTFHMENLKMLIPFVGKTALGMVEKLPVASGEEVEIDVAEWFQTVTEDAITLTAFGRSFEEGKAVFKLQAQHMLFAAEAFRNVFIPGYRFLPTKKNTNSWKLEKEIKRRLAELIVRRREMPAVQKHGHNAKDLLGLMINASAATASRRPSPMRIGDIVEECKTFFFAGKQTTSNLLTWTTVLLATHPEWQERARAEVLRVCGARDIPSADQLTKLKTLGMIINETLRLYPPAVATIRRAKYDVELGGYRIPRGTEVLVPIMGLHHDEELWGPDVHRFDPGRFAQGPSRAARHPAAFIPFGLGPRRCIGQNLAILEAKLTVAVLLQRLAFRVAPTYVHAPTVLMLLYPQHGAPVLFRALNSSS